MSCIVLYVSINGNDQWSGRLDAPSAGGDDGPLATLAGARNAIRRLKRRGALDEPVEVRIRGGTYRMSRPLSLCAADSGTAECPITYTSAAGQQPVLSGGKIIDRWKPYKDKIVCADLPEVRAGLWRFRQLFLNNLRMTRARYPKLDRDDPLYGGWAFVEALLPDGGDAPTLEKHEPLRSIDACPTAFRFEPGVFHRHWAKPRLAEIFVIPGRSWISDIIPIRGVDFGNRAIYLTRPVGPSANTLGAATHLAVGNRFYVENNLEDLTEPGEWCLDHETGTLYFWPPDGVSLESSEVVAPVATRLIELIGTPSDPVSHVSIRGLTFRHTQEQWPTPDSYYKTPNAGQTVYLENTDHCAIEDNTFDAIGGDAIRLQNANAWARITGNTISHAGAYGIFVASLQRGFCRHDPCSGDLPNPPEWFAHLEDREPAARMWPKSRGHVIANNHIHHVGRFEKHGLGIAFYGVSAIDVTVAHNLIHDTPRFGIGLMSGFGRVTIEYNDLHDLSQETCDTGGICFNRWYTYEHDPDLSRGCIVRFNRIRNVVGCGAYGKKMEVGGSAKAGGRIWTPYYSWAIYFDNAPMNVHVHGNITAGNTLGGLMISHYANDVLVENNIFLDSDQSQVYLLLAGQTSNLRIRRNIFSYSNPSANYLRLNLGAGIDLQKVIAEFDHNLLHNAAGNALNIDGLPGEAVQRVGMEVQQQLPSIDDWRKLGFDAHSIVADPLFVDRAAGNFDLRPDSPALTLGFEPIPTWKIGHANR